MKLSLKVKICFRIHRSRIKKWLYKKLNKQKPPNYYGVKGNKLFCWREHFISPCVLNSINCGTHSKAIHVPKIMFIGFDCKD